MVALRRWSAHLFGTLFNHKHVSSAKGKHVNFISETIDEDSQIKGLCIEESQMSLWLPEMTCERMNNN